MQPVHTRKPARGAERRNLAWLWKRTAGNQETTTAMRTNVERAAKLQQTATRMMLEGNVQRYLHALRLLVAVRRRNLALA